MTAPYSPRVAFYAPLKAPDHPVASGDRTIARLLMNALTLSGASVTLASRLRAYDRGDEARQARLAALGRRVAARLLRRWHRHHSEAPVAWFCYHLYAKAPDYVGPVVCEALGIPYLVAEATTAPRHGDSRWAPGHAATVAALRGASAVIALNRRDMPAVAPLLPSGAEHAFLRPFLDVDAHRVLTPEERAAERDRGGGSWRAIARTADPRLPWVVSVAMMRGGDKLASYTMLARACAEVTTPFELLVAGDGEAAPEVRAAFAGLQRPVRWLGALDGDELRTLLPTCDLFAWPGVNEAFGMAMLEAQASGVPVLSCAAGVDVTALGGVAEVVAHEQTGWLCPAGDGPAFTAALQALLEEPARRARYATAARARVKSTHNVTNAAQQLRGIIDTAIHYSKTRS